MRNWNQITRTVNWILDHPKEWNQVHWVSGCGTSYCFAGATLMLDGCTFEIGAGQVLAFTTLEGERLYSYEDNEWIPQRAARLLGIDGYDARALFFGTDTDIQELADLINKWARQDGVTSPFEGVDLS